MGSTVFLFYYSPKGNFLDLKNMIGLVARSADFFGYTSHEFQFSFDVLVFKVSKSLHYWEISSSEFNFFFSPRIIFSKSYPWVK